MLKPCSYCSKPWPLAPSVNYVKNNMRTRIYAHMAPDGKTRHSTTDTQYAPGEPDTPMPAKAQSVSLAPPAPEPKRKPRGRMATR